MLPENATPMNEDIQILFSDEHILAVAKPSGLAVIPQRYAHQEEDLKTMLEKIQGKLFVVHRIDKETSGVVLFARTAEAHRDLNIQFTSRDVDKRYHAVVSPCPSWEDASADLPLHANVGAHHLTVVDRREGKPSLTQFHVLERLGRYALVEAKPRTGRTHQIRVHAVSLGIPVVADALYGDGKPVLLSALKRGYKGDPHTERPLLARLGLHASCITLRHPVSKESLTVSAGYPRDFAATLKQLRKLSPHA
jgi:RluA family pseudouridine synthase